MFFRHKHLCNQRRRNPFCRNNGCLSPSEWANHCFAHFARDGGRVIMFEMCFLKMYWLDNHIWIASFFRRLHIAGAICCLPSFSSIMNREKEESEDTRTNPPNWWQKHYGSQKAASAWTPPAWESSSNALAAHVGDLKAPNVHICFHQLHH